MAHRLASQILVRAKNHLDAERKGYEKLVAGVQLNCDHAIVAERPYKTMTYVDDFPPRRICLCCALEEEGWTFKKLKDTDARLITLVDDDKFYECRI